MSQINLPLDIDSLEIISQTIEKHRNITQNEDRKKKQNTRQK